MFARFSMPAALLAAELSAKEVAAHETFPGFFRLNW